MVADGHPQYIHVMNTTGAWQSRPKSLKGKFPTMARRSHVIPGEVAGEVARSRVDMIWYGRQQCSTPAMRRQGQLIGDSYLTMLRESKDMRSA